MYRADILVSARRIEGEAVAIVTVHAARAKHASRLTDIDDVVRLLVVIDPGDRRVRLDLERRWTEGKILDVNLGRLAGAERDDGYGGVRDGDQRRACPASRSSNAARGYRLCGKPCLWRLHEGPPLTRTRDLAPSWKGELHDFPDELGIDGRSSTSRADPV